MEKLIRAIAHCHDCGISHRDIKPENILIDKNDEIKLIDFGLSKHLDRNIRTFKTRVGTPSYMAPEVVLGRNYDFKCDIWSIGVLMYHLLSNQVPFIGETLEETLALISRCHCNFNLPIFKKVS